MSRELLSLLIGVLLFVSVLGHGGHHHHHEDEDEGGDDGESAVIKATAANFKDIIAQHPLSLVEFFAPWCGHCKSLKPQYEAAADQLKGEVALIAVDCTTERSLCNEYDVKGFPTLKVFRNDGSKPAEYSEGRKTADIVKFLRKQNQPAYLVCKTEDLAGVKDQEGVVVVGYFKSESDEAAAGFIEVAKLLRNDYAFRIVLRETDVPAVELLKEEGTVKMQGNELTKEKITEFIVAEAFPLVGEIGPDNYEKYIARGLPLVWLFLDYSADASKQVLEVAAQVAADFKARLSIVKLDGVRWAEHAKNFGLSGNTPGIVAEDRENSLNYVFPEDKPINYESLKAHLQGFLDGTLQPTFKSEEIPATNDGPVKVLVGKNFDELVIKNNKDVFVEFYAPWCGHCKSLAPKWEKLGEMFASNPNIVIAKIDATANDVAGVDVRGFPTIYLYPANDKTKPIQYSGDRTEKAMADWLKKNAVNLKEDKASASEASASEASAEEDKKSAEHDEL